MNQRPPLNIDTWKMVRKAFRYLKPHRGAVSAGIVFLVLSSALAMITPWMVKLSIDSLVAGGNLSGISRYLLIIVVITVFQAVFRYLMRRFIIDSSRRAEYDLRNELYFHVQQLPITFFHKYRTGDIMSRLANDVQAVRMIFGPTILQIGNTLVSLVIALGLMIAIDIKLTLIALAPMPLLPFAFYFLGRKVRHHSNEVQEQLATITTHAQETLSGITVIKGYNLQERESGRFQDISREYVRRNMSLVRVRGLFMPLMTLLAGVSTIVILFFGGWWVMEDRITLGSLVAFMDYLFRLTWPMFAIGWVVGLIQQGSASMARIEKFLHEHPLAEMLPDHAKEDPHSLADKIEFDNVSFRYREEGPWILKDVSFEIQRGEMVAVMGPSGAGKTLLIHLLTKTLTPTSGTIRIGGRDIRDLSAFDVRETIGVMPQDIVLFSETISRNVSFGNDSTVEAEIRKALETAELNEEVELFPRGLDTRLGERGVNLSGGQKQRMTLARLLVRGTPVLLLDDPFSSVDIYTEEAIIGALDELRRQSTLIVVSHRVNTARRADRILIFRDSRLVEQGSHEELLDARGYYYRLFVKQQLSRELEAM